MALVRVRHATGSTLEDALRVAHRDLPTFDFPNLDPVVAFAALDIAPTMPCGVWLRSAPGYPAVMMARDVKTLCAMVHLTDVVIEGPAAPRYVDALRALLVDGPITFSNEVAQVRDVINRPVPKRVPTLWWVDGERLRCATTTLKRVGWRHDADAAITRYN